MGPIRRRRKKFWIKLHNEELHDLYCSPNIMQLIKSRWVITVIVGKVSGTGNSGKAYRFLVGKPKGMKALGRPRYGKKKSNSPRIAMKAYRESRGIAPLILYFTTRWW